MNLFRSGLKPVELLPLADVTDFVNKAEAGGKGYDRKVRVHFLRNYTIENIDPFLKYYCYGNDIEPGIVYGNYDNIQQEILQPDSHIYTGKPEIIVLSVILDPLLPGGEWDVGTVAGITGRLEQFYNQLLEKTSALIVINTFVPPFEADHGIANPSDIWDLGRVVDHVNRFVRGFALKYSSRLFVADWERFVRVLGEKEAMDYRFWYMSRALFKPAFLDMYALEIAKIVYALKGKTKKCLVLDCDNTLWGGIIGEDGIDGIKLDPHQYPGNVFYRFQRDVLTLYRRGVLVTLCSKNNEEDVWDVLDNHPHCLLKREHISAFRINWQDKANNIRAMAAELNLGIDSFVFVDDSGMECELVSSMIPEIIVRQVPKKLYAYPRLLFKEGFFDTLVLTAEDGKRTELYRSENQRREEQGNYQSMEDFLSSLQLTVDIRRAEPKDIPRVAQLTQKTNQFNFTTRRYSETQIAEFCNAGDKAVWIMRVKDKFGDMGLTGVMIIDVDGQCAEVDTFLLSCRILGRNLDLFFYDHCFGAMEVEHDITRWKALYLPTKKNGQIANFWLQKAGFLQTDQQGGGTAYEINAADRIKPLLPYIKIVS